ncbi:DNA/RNA endonuclease G [Cryobacterium psychrophilum]|uniref:DNA/RNA endonuclease G n=1 Tax=Cryobacterium psychrophilum TaxID=41988 RepID=A0A4Y8KR79_9MICO|nr:DNA/RNA endonuclease G [Cryobacterium psychrophilum]TFD81753.1 DNA/RNA endonuclease G [Cryobacterium psychrophilum]
MSAASQRVIRRETHSPRTVAMTIAVILAIVALAYLGTEIVLSLLAQPGLLVSPMAAGNWLTGLPDQQPVWAILTAAVLLAIVGVVFILLALTPGRLPKHQIVRTGRVVLVDNAVIAAALAQHLSDHTGIARDRVTIGVSRRVVDVTVAPDAGLPVPDARIRDLVAAELDTYQLVRPISTRVRPTKQREGAPS